MYSATGVEATTDIATTSGCAISASTTALLPCTTLKTPLGKPASMNSSASRIDADGVRSEGLSMNVLPHAAAITNIQHGTTIGKLNGVTPAATPSGCRRFQLSMPPLI